MPENTMDSTPDIAHDALTRLLEAHRLEAHVFRHETYQADWVLPAVDGGRPCFHLIGRGRAWLRLGRDGASLSLGPGDLVAFPHAAWHELCGRPAGAGPGSQDPTTVICGHFVFGEEPVPRGTGGEAPRALAANPLLAALPEVMVIRAGEPRSTRLRSLLGLMVDEAEAAEPGRRYLLDRLADGLFVELVRHQLSYGAPSRGLLAGLADARIRRALDAMYLDPGRPWQVESLARVAGMSRTAFAQRFPELMGKTPLAYLTELRMREADRLLRERRHPVAAVANRLGYATEAAFRRAFKRVWGVGPGQRRRAAHGPRRARG